MTAISPDITFWARRNEKKIEYSTKCIGEAKASSNPNRLATFSLQIAVGWMWNHKCLKAWSLGSLKNYCLLRRQTLFRWHKSLEVSVEVWEFSSTSFLLSKQPMRTIWAAASYPCCQSVLCHHVHLYPRMWDKMKLFPHKLLIRDLVTVTRKLLNPYILVKNMLIGHF